MTKQEAVDFMIKKVEELERDSLSLQNDPTKLKQEAVEREKALKKGRNTFKCKRKINLRFSWYISYQCYHI